MEKTELPIILKLTEPFFIGSKKIEEITFKHDLKAEFMVELPVTLDSSAFKMQHFIPLIVGMCAEPTVVVENLRAKDFLAAIKIVSNFF